MLFSLIPDIEYSKSPISYPFSESDYVIAKNFFRGFEIDENIFDYAVYFDKYVIQDGERLDTIAYQFYNDVTYDWVIAITNKLVNPGYDLPLGDNALRTYIEEKYGDDAYSGIHHYETEEVKEINGAVVQALGLVVDEKYHTSQHEFNNGAGVVSLPGSQISTAITNYDHEVKENEKHREIYLLKPDLLHVFVSNFKRSNKYTDSTDYVSTTLKKTNSTI